MEIRRILCRCPRRRRRETEITREKERKTPTPFPVLLFPDFLAKVHDRVDGAFFLQAEDEILLKVRQVLRRAAAVTKPAGLVERRVCHGQEVAEEGQDELERLVVRFSPVVSLARERAVAHLHDDRHRVALVLEERLLGSEEVAALLHQLRGRLVILGRHRQHDEELEHGKRERGLVAVLAKEREELVLQHAHPADLPVRLLAARPRVAPEVPEQVRDALAAVLAANERLARHGGGRSGGSFDHALFANAEAPDDQEDLASSAVVVLLEALPLLLFVEKRLLLLIELFLGLSLVLGFNPRRSGLGRGNWMSSRRRGGGGSERSCAVFRLGRCQRHRAWHLTQRREQRRHGWCPYTVFSFLASFL